MHARVALPLLLVAMMVVAPLVASQDTTLSAISMKPGTAKFYDEGPLLSQPSPTSLA
jgi:hypothetical protein